METTPAPAPTHSKTTPKDFFLWLGAIIALYGSITALITLKFEYINYLFPDPLAYAGDPYGGAVRTAMATLIVLVPTMIVLFRFINTSIAEEPGKANIWVRRWALGLTLFISVVVGLIDLAVLINTFLGGEITMRFGLKVLAVLCVAIATFAYFYLSLKGFWSRGSGKANNIVAIVVLLAMIATVVAGFFIIGTPADVRKLRFDEQKVNDLRSIQYQVIDYWRVKQALPTSLDTLKDPLSDVAIPADPQEGYSYAYEKTGTLSFKLCATFNRESKDTTGQGAYPTRDISYSGPGGGADENWQHGAGATCFERTIDPDKYGPIPAPKPL